MSGGYTGKILRINLTTRKISIIGTTKYEEWGGGHGMGSAIFWDLVQDKTIDGFDPKNVVTIMTSPLSGTLVPAASSRTEVQGIGIQSSPIGWFTRGNFGGRFGAMLKFAGWDGIVVEGKATKPVWVDIKNEKVTIREAGHLWGMDTMETQKAIWIEAMGGQNFDNWMNVGRDEDGPKTTQKPAVLTIGPAGENLSRTACLIHDAGNASGQGGFGGVWGSKNLKAVSVIGTGDVNIADPNALIESRLWAKNDYGFGVNPDSIIPSKHTHFSRQENARMHGCIGCHAGCQERASSGIANDSTCTATYFYKWAERKKNWFGKTEASNVATELLQKYGINAFEAFRGLKYIYALNRKGILGSNKEIDCDLDFDDLGTVEFAEEFLRMLALRKGIGDDFAEGFYRAAQRWGRLEEDLKTGLLQYSYWGLPEHSYDPRADVTWGYGSILGDRDINEHDFMLLFFIPWASKWPFRDSKIPAEWVVQKHTDIMEPFAGDMQMLDYSTENIYSEHMAKTVAWHRYYTRFWKQSVLYCDNRWPNFISDEWNRHGLSGEGEPRFFNAVTGKNYSFLDGINIGRKIWNLDNAIWTLQGRHRDMVHFSEYIYHVPYKGFLMQDILAVNFKYYLPGRKNGRWDWINVNGRHLDRGKFEGFKTRYYDLEGWDESSGWPKRSTLESLGMKYVADELDENGKLGKG